MSQAADPTDRPASNQVPENAADKSVARGLGKTGMNVDVQQYMNMNHFEQLMVLFQEHEDETGEGGFDIDKFREVFGIVVGGNLTHDQMTMLFMKIDANSDGSVDWDEFSTYMMGRAKENSEAQSIFDERVRKLFNSPHKDIIRYIDYIAKERKYITVSREGTVCYWSSTLKLQRIIAAKDFNRHAWVADAVYLAEHNRLITVTDDRHFCVHDIASVKPRLVVTLGQLEHNPLCIAYGGHLDEDRDLILFGDEGGYVNVLNITRKFLTDNEAHEELSPLKLSKKDSLKKHNATFLRRKVHNDWVTRVHYYPEINAFISCAPESIRSLVIGDIERKSFRSVNVPKGIKCFEFCRRPSFLVTGGRDKIIRLWNPYVLSKPAGTLHGHTAAIANICVNHEEGHIISLSEDRVIKIWSARSLNCMQTLAEKIPQKPDDLISAIFFDQWNGQLVMGSEKLQSWPLYKTHRAAVSRSHDAGVVAAMFNENFHQVVSGAQDGTICIWDIATGERAFSYHNAHGKLEITAMCFDRSGRRLVTGSRDGVIKMWNFNNGQILRRMNKDNALEVTDVLYVEMGANRFIVGVGWDRKVTIFLDDPGHFEARPVRIMHGGGAGTHRGHQDDISSVAFAPPSVLATASVDGIIVIWSLESGYMKLTLSEPFLDLRSKEEKSIEKIVFMPSLDRRSKKVPVLVSVHADGCLRAWDAGEGGMVFEMNCQASEDEGLTVMSISSDGGLIILGGSKGHVRVLDVNPAALAARPPGGGGNGDPFCVQKTIWRAHMQSISSVNYANVHNIILTCSKDCTIRVWTLSGTHIGIFGQDTPWILGDASTYRPHPEDVQQAARMEAEYMRMIVRHQEGLKKNVIESWRGLRGAGAVSAVLGDDDPPRQVTDPKEGDSPTEDRSSASSTPDNQQIFEPGERAESQPLESGGKARGGTAMADIKRMRVRAIRMQALTKWFDVYERRKCAADWTVTPDLTGGGSQTKAHHFALRPPTKPHPPRPRLNVSSSAVYHMLAYYPLAQIEVPSMLGGKRRGAGDKAGVDVAVGGKTGGLPSLRKERGIPQVAGKQNAIKLAD
ncbi:WD40-repeat-containing domain protein [Fimicolochytrium jonesii]|uniref:WD40-repeat-containing domain protein n=1 Tax=Fimicolochytrium jonesii TaxID=1396493 RepID=UPI0022FF15DF|nr:WD40-repeat-containing domain protein [Fimicolochytrium jonesii]KAI8818479.1 WD40-repeat-containing domain protein [Fimicolochytrium jonesii]